MSRSNPIALLGLLLAVLAALGGAALIKGGFYVGRHEGDTLHMIDIVLRMAEGERPHRDFMTPIGALSFAPIVLFVKAGLGIGMATLAAQVLVAACLLPMVWWVAMTRLSARLAAFFGVTVLILVLALVHGEALQAVSISMHYNRWAWAIAFVAIVAATLPPVHPKNAVVDGLIIGLCMAALVMIKVTYFAAFTPAVLAGLWLGGQRRALAVALVTGLAVAAGLTLWLGGDYWTAYVADLMTVRASDVRGAPGLDFNGVVGAPQYLMGSLVMIGSVILLRQAGVRVGGLVALLLMPAFFYVTFQNFGNDPQWLLLLPVLLLSLRPSGDIKNAFGWPLRGALGIAAAMALAIEAPSFVNLAYSPFRHLRLAEEDYSPLLPRGGLHSDFQTAKIRALRVDARVGLDGDGMAFAAYREGAGRDEASSFQGETFPFCTTELGVPAFYDTIAQDLEGAGFGGKRVFAADLFTFFHLYGNFPALENGAPWYYGGLPGYASADLLLLPVCPMAQDVQQMILKAVSGDTETKWTEVRRTPIYVLFERG